MKKLFFALLLLASILHADCVFNAKSATSYQRIDNHTILLKGGLDREFILQTYCSVYQSSDVIVLKDSFCSYENSVLYIDKEVCDIKSVKKL